MFVKDVRGIPNERVIPELDGLRGLAILFVLWFHFGFTYFSRFTSGLDTIPLAILRFGWSGVDLFFVLSGFLITGILLDTREANNYFISFYGRRVLRIFPIYYAVLAIWFLFVPAFLLHHRNEGFVANVVRSDLQGWYWTYTQNIANAVGQDIYALSHLWSLAVEEQFYVAWALLVWLVRTPRLTLRLAFIGVVCAFIVRLVLVLQSNSLAGANFVEAAHRLTVCRMDALFVGAALASGVRLSSRQQMAKLGRSASGICVAAFIIIGILGNGWEWSAPVVQTAGYSVLAFTFGSLLLISLDTNSHVAAICRNSALRSMGKFSYAIYVVHWPIHVLGKGAFARVLPLDDRLGIALYIVGGTAVSYALARLSWVLVEAPALRMKRYFEPSFIPPSTNTAISLQ